MSVQESITDTGRTRLLVHDVALLVAGHDLCLLHALERAHRVLCGVEGAGEGG